MLACSSCIKDPVFAPGFIPRSKLDFLAGPYNQAWILDSIIIYDNIKITLKLCELDDQYVYNRDGSRLIDLGDWRCHINDSIQKVTLDPFIFTADTTGITYIREGFLNATYKILRLDAHNFVIQHPDVRKKITYYLHH